MSEEENTTQFQPQQEATKTYTVRHNKQDVELTFDELVKNAEKGLDYDRIRPSHELVKELAKRSGDDDVSHFIENMKNEAQMQTSNSAEQQDVTPAVQNNNLEAIKKEYPEFIKNGEVELPEDAAAYLNDGMSELEALRANDLRKTKELCRELTARLEVESANRTNSAAAIGSLVDTEAPEKEFYSSKEWDKLPDRQKDKLIKSGKIFEFMKKWSVK